MVAMFAGCSTTKDGFVYRTYHNTTVHYNGYFNANEALKKGVAKIKEANKDDYDQILPLFIYGDEETAKGSFEDMERVLEKSNKVIDKHTMKFGDREAKNRKHPVLNKWIDDSYLLMGKAYFYKRNFFKAEEIFQYVGRKYKEEDTQLAANVWLARSFIERKEWTRALGALNKDEPSNKIDDALQADYYQVFAELYIAQGSLDKAAEKLEEALKHIDKKRQRSRPLFVLAQLNQRLNRCAEAQRYFKEVEKSRPVYEMEFYAKINRATSYCRTSGSSAEIRAELMKMLRDDKNLNYRDQIYYALADIEIEEQHRPEAIDYLNLSLEVNVNNEKQRSKSHLRLADLYFDQRQYENAQVAYDSTLSHISEDHVRYKEIKARAESLTELVGYLNVIQLNDSLNHLCTLDEPKLIRSLKRAQKAIEDDIEERKRLEEELAAKLAEGKTEEQGSGTFWLYNSSLRAKGYKNFIDYWGERPLEDNWRRSNKLQTAFSNNEEEEQPDTAAVVVKSEITDEVPSIEELIASLPCNDPAKMDQLRMDIAEAYYNCGVLYKEKLDDNDNAINSWEQLVTGYDETEYHPTSYYQLFRTYLTKEQEEDYKNPFCATCNSQYWGQQILERYPGSEWAKLVENPEYLDFKDLKEANERAAYELVYRSYVDRNYPQVIDEATLVIDNEPENHLLCKYRLLRAIAVGYSDAPFGIKQNYQNELTQIVQRCKGSEEADRAGELLASSKGDGTSQLTDTPKIEESTGEDTQVRPEETEPPKVTPFSMHEGMEHYFAVVLPVKDNDINRVKAAVADFNGSLFASAALKVTNNLFNKENHIVLVKPFKVVQEAMDYSGAFVSDKDILSEINANPYTSFVIDKINYITLFKNKDIDAYLEFYNQNY